jgi:hypothetical protein
MLNRIILEHFRVFSYLMIIVNFIAFSHSAEGQGQCSAAPGQACRSTKQALTQLEVAAIAKAAGFQKCEALATIVAIAGAESQYFPDCICENGRASTDWGLWQANDLRANAFHPYDQPPTGRSPDLPNCALNTACAARYAFTESFQGTNFETAWPNTYDNRNGPFLQYLKDAEQAATSVGCCANGICAPPPPSSALRVSVETITSGDPNEKAGSEGSGAQQYISGATPLRYAIFFSNKETASASAQDITVTDQLDVTDEDLKSFSLGPVGFGNQLITPPAGVRSFSGTVDLRPANNLLVKVDASLNLSSGLLAWHFNSLDPATNQPPLDPTAGFLPPGGEGSVFFTVMPKESLPTNTAINNQATIVFDVNAPISTQTWLNTIDNDKPISHVLALAAQSPANIPLQWTGTDLGAGVQDFTIFVSDNSGPFTPFLTNTPSTSTTFPGQAGHSYAFFSTARDLVGNVEDAKTVAEAITAVPADAIPPNSVALVSPPPNTNGWNNTNVTATISSTDNPGGSGVQQITFSSTGGQLIPTTNVSGNSVSATISSEGVTNLSFFATDFAQNVEPAHTLPIRIDKTPPSINGSRTPLANANGWNNTNVSVSFACSDALSGLDPDSPTAPTLLTTEGANQQVTGTCQDLAGNVASATVSGINIDKTPPALSGLPAAGCTLWPPDKKFVTVAMISGADVLSGISSFNVIGMSNEPQDPSNPDIIISGAGTQPRTVQLRANRLGNGTGRVYALTTTATDVAGNTTTAVSTCTVPHDQGN